MTKLFVGLFSAFALVVTVAGCAITSGVMEAEGGTYLISARAAPARGGTAGASEAAYKEAQEFCTKKGRRAVVVQSNERDTYQGFGTLAVAPSGGGGSSGMFAHGSVQMRFRCVD